jgi:hypothetical protein
MDSTGGAAVNNAPATPREWIRPMGGLLEGSIYENSATRKSMRLRYDLRVDLAPALLPGWQDDGGELSAGPMDLGLRSWRQLDGRQYAFPADPPSYYVDGEQVAVEPYTPGVLQRFGRSFPLRVVSLGFGKVSAAMTVPARIEIAAEVDLPGVETGLQRIVIEAELALGAVLVRGDLSKLRAPALDQALQIAGQFLSLEDYEPAGGDLVRLHPKKDGAWSERTHSQPAELDSPART